MSISSARIINIIISVLMLGVVVFTIYDNKDYNQFREQTSIQAGDSVKQIISKEIEAIISNIMEKAETLADSISINRPKGDNLESLIINESLKIDEILGITVAFEPYMYDESIRLFAPYYDKNMNELIYIEDRYDYTNDTLTTSQWYVQVKKKGSRWVDPYFAEGAQAMVSDYGTPFYFVDEDTGERALAGTITMTISLSSFSKLLNSISLGKTGYGFVISKSGNFVAHPIHEYVSNLTLQEVALENDDSVLYNIAQKMINGKNGHEEYINTISKQQSYLFYQYIPQSAWSLGIVFIKNELLGSPFQLKRNIFHIVFSISVFVIFLLILLLKLYKLKENNLWTLSFLTSIVIVVMICVEWYLTMNYSYTENDNQAVVTNETALNRLINIENRKALQLRNPQPIIIPTGLYIREIQFTSSYNVNISGVVWQQYADSLKGKVSQQFFFPQISPHAEGLYINKLSQEQKDGYKLITYDFRGTFLLDFDYSPYPFDFRLISLKLGHPNKDLPIILVPDLNSYKIINKLAIPGVNKEISMPDSKIEASYFGYQMKKFNASFGHESFSKRGEIPILNFNILLSRVFINAFVTNIIPIFVVALMVYFVVYTSSKKRTRSGFSSFGVVESSAAFFFVLLLAHIDLRKTVNTPIITYMESYYFIMYFLLAVVVFNVVMFTRKDNFLFFEYKDNLIIKLLFWPLFLGMCLIITLVNFY